jgi:hypothetical protein
MKSYRIFLFCAALAVPGMSLRAQTSASTSANANPKAVWLKGVVVHADRNSIVVREKGNPLFIHTFTYSPRVKAHMESLENQGGNFHSGDAVQIRYRSGSTVAMKIHGKPSKQ